MPNKKEQLPKYVSIYNDLLAAIDSGEFQPGTALPSEDVLANQFSVSRMTLRQALSLLREDGRIVTRKGSGTVVNDTVQPATVGIENAENPIRSICQETITAVDFTMGLSYSNAYTRQLFGRDSPAGVHFDCVYQSKGARVAYSYGIMLIDSAEKFKLDLEDQEQMQAFISKDIYQLIRRRQLTFKIGVGTESVQQKSLSSLSNTYLITFESLFDQQDQLLLFTKYYVPIEEVNMTLNLTAN
ncbi:MULTISPECIES: GntR family transcriptional regulator [Lactobacillaceae]|uniref:GntR family transcriptional regulator n=1 Tax=Lactobacillaceae TaxID=33958 RepID=UPI001457297F|nr:GntR family transcriptional regulator [Lactobacillus sp. HBUAS51381]NLR10529.1 GntR family transcriptional regulator [Lactobacillus sp. HBUAS51381]